MSDTSPFGTAVAEAPAPALGPDPYGAEPSRRRTTVVLLTLLAVTVGAAGGWVLWSGGQDTTPSPAKAPRAHAARPAPQPVQTTAPVAPELRDSADVRDPFAPLVVAETASPTDTNGGTTTGGTTTGGTTPTGDVALTVVDVTGTSQARVRVGEQTYAVVPGDTFAEGFALVELTAGSCGSFTFDAGEPFTLCEGETKQVSSADPAK